MTIYPCYAQLVIAHVPFVYTGNNEIWFPYCYDYGLTYRYWL